jgi:hypothetical protein
VRRASKAINRGWRVSLRLRGGRSGWAVFNIVVRKVAESNPLAKDLLAGCGRKR